MAFARPRNGVLREGCEDARCSGGLGELRKFGVTSALMGSPTCMMATAICPLNASCRRLGKIHPLYGDFGRCASRSIPPQDLFP